MAYDAGGDGVRRDRSRLNRPTWADGTYRRRPGSGSPGRCGGRTLTYLAISIGAVLGANARFLVGRWVADRLGASFPYGTFLINTSGSFVLGLVLTLASERGVAPWWLRPGVAIGFLGSYTTFLTFSYETLQLVQGGSLVAAVANVAGSVTAALAGVYLGTVLARAL